MFLFASTAGCLAVAACSSFFAVEVSSFCLLLCALSLLRVAWIGLYGDLLGAGLTDKALRPDKDSVEPTDSFRANAVIVP